jgi:hypothetical protein
VSDAPLAALTPERRGTLYAVVDRILPGVHGPGAADTNAAAAVEHALRHRFFRGLVPGIAQVLDRLQAQARQMFANEFAACTPVQRDELLRALADDPHPWTCLLWRALIALSLEGLLGEPRHGGNREYRGWEAMGLRAAEVEAGFCRGPRYA